MTRADRLTLVRQLAQEGLSQRAIAKRLKVSKDTVRRDLDRIAAAAEPDGAPASETAGPAEPQVTEDASEGPAPDGAPQSAPMPDPHAGIDVSQCRGVRPPQARPGQTGQTTQAQVIHAGVAVGLGTDGSVCADNQAVIAMAHAYRRALAHGDITPGVPFCVREMALTPLLHRAVPVEAG